jgi:hypothetical protein
VATNGGGDIDITYGNRVNATITGQILTIYATLSPNQDIVWLCGRQTAPSTDNTVPTGSTNGTNLINKYLPRSCQT